MNQIACVREEDHVALPDGCVEVVSRIKAIECERWAHAFGAEAKDHRYYELVEDTIHEEFDYGYFIVRDETGEVCAIQPFFILDLDLLVGTKPQFGWVTDFIRRRWPGFMRARTLMVGCAAGEGHLDGRDELARRTSASLLASALVEGGAQAESPARGAQGVSGQIPPGAGMFRGPGFYQNSEPSECHAQHRLFELRGLHAARAQRQRAQKIATETEGDRTGRPDRNERCRRHCTDD